MHIVAFMWARHAMKSPICKVHEEDDMDMGGDWIAGCHVNVFAGKKKKNTNRKVLSQYIRKNIHVSMSPLMQRDQLLASWHVWFRSSFLLFSPVDFWRIWSFQKSSAESSSLLACGPVDYPAPIGMQDLFLCVEDYESSVTLWSYVE